MTAFVDTTANAAVAKPEIDAGPGRASTRLRNLLRMNAAFSTATGAVGLIAAGPVAEFLGVDQIWFLRLLGAGLLGFAAAVLAVSGATTPALHRWSLIISLNDLGWVAGTAAVIGFGWLSIGGAIAMGLIGLVVLDLGIAQMRARTRLTATAAETR